MQLGKVIGKATATTKHSSLEGWRLQIVQLLDAKGGSEADPVLVLDSLGARSGDTVMITSDSKMISEMVGTKATPARFAVLGLTEK